MLSLKLTDAEKAGEYWITLARTEPVQFVREALRHQVFGGEKTMVEDAGASWALDEFQIELLEAMADVWRKRMPQYGATRINHDGKPWITIRSGHGPGKTHTAALLEHVFNFAWPGRIIATAPKFDQVKTRLWNAYRKIDARAMPWYRRLHEVNDTTVFAKTVDERGRITIDKTWCMLAETASKPENLAGHHERFQMVVVEEASGVPESLWPTIMGALSGSGGLQIMIIISNPTKEQGFFADSHRKRETEQHFFRYHVTLEKSKRVDRAWYQKLVDKYGIDSPVVRVRGRGEFPGASANQLIALEWIERARLKEVNAVIGDGSLPRLRVSVDCGAGGTGETVCTAFKHFTSIRIGLKQTRHSFKLETASEETADAAEVLFYKFGGRKGEDDFVVDSLGVGVGAAGLLFARGHRIVTYQGGSASDAPTLWRNRRVQSYINLRNDLRDATLALLESFFDDRTDWDDFDAQLCSIQTPGGDRVDDLITKDRMQQMGLPSPDLADSLAMQYATQAPKMVTMAMPRSEAARAEVVIHRSTVNQGLEGL